MVDLKKSIEHLGLNGVTAVVSGAAEARDYLGDTTNNEGVPMGRGRVVSVSANLGTADAAGLGVTVHNVTDGTSEDLTIDGTYDQVDTDLYFSDGDELALEVTAVDGTTPGADGHITVHHRPDLSPMN